MIPPIVEYKEFENDEQKREKFIEWKLISEKSKKLKETFLYKGVYTSDPLKCKVIGYQSNHTVIIEIEDGRVHSIHPAYLKKMQKKDFQISYYEEHDYDNLQ